jgi:hypothetical protein
MQPCYSEVAQFVLYSISAVLWMESARVRLTPIRASQFSGGAAFFMALGVVVQGLTIVSASGCLARLSSLGG